MLQHLRAGAGGLVLAALTFFLNPADAAPADESPWQLRHVEPETDTRIYLRSRGAAVPAFRGVTRLQARLSTLVALLLDTEQMPEWVFRVRRVRPIEAPDPMHGVTQVITGMPWPLQDREAIVAWTLTQDAMTAVVTMDGRSAPDKLAPDAQFVRMPAFESQWRLTPLPGGLVEVQFTGLGDPGGNLAVPPLSYFMHGAVWEAPLATLNGMRRMSERPVFRDATLAFVREPAP